MMEAQADLVFGEVPPPGSYTAILLLCPHMMGKGKKALRGLFYKDTNPIYKSTIPMT